MKKTLILLSLLIPAFAFVACDNDDDLPNVEYDVTFSDATVDNNTVYVVQGETFEVSSIKVTNKESNKNAGITQANYFWDYNYIGTSVQPPYTFRIQLDENVALGKHVLEIETPVYAVDKAPAFAVLSFNVEVVESADDLPEVAAPAVLHATPSMNKTDKK